MAGNVEGRLAGGIHTLRLPEIRRSSCRRSRRLRRAASGRAGRRRPLRRRRSRGPVRSRCRRQGYPEWPADWQRHYAALQELVRDEEGGAGVLPGVTVHMDIGRFVARQRQRAALEGLLEGDRLCAAAAETGSTHRRAKLPADRLARLAALGLDWAAA
ncbi:helicase associated domain-containing protein [Streptomyces sp. NPDC002285]